MLSTVGFDNMMDYRLAANIMMMTSSLSFAGIVFKLTAYIQMFANFYISLSGLKTGFEYLDLKRCWLYSYYMLQTRWQQAADSLYCISSYFSSELS